MTMTEQKSMLDVSAGAEEGHTLSDGFAHDEVSKEEINQYNEARKLGLQESLEAQRKSEAKEAQERFGLEPEVFSRVGETALARLNDEILQDDWNKFAGVNQPEHGQTAQESGQIKQAASGVPVIDAPEARELVKH